MARRAPSRTVLLCLLIVSAGQITSHVPAHAHNGALAVARPVTGIAVDGDLSEWPQGMPRYPISFLGTGVPPVDDADLRAWFRVGYDEADGALYLAVEVEDGSVVTDTTAWRNWLREDGCEVFLAPEHRGRPLYSLLGSRPGAGGDPMEAVVRTDGTRRSYEWRIDVERRTEGRARLRAGLVLGLDVGVCDRDEDGSFSWLVWGASGPPKSAATERLGDVVLAPAEPPTGTVSGTARWQDGQIRGNRAILLAPAGGEPAFSARSDRSGRFHIEAPAGTYDLVVDGGQRRRIEVAPSGSVDAGTLVYPLPDGRHGQLGPGTLYAVTGRLTLAGLGSRKGPWQTLNVGHGLPDPSVADILQDKEGYLWFATQGGGLSRYDGHEFVTITQDDGLASNLVSSVAQTPDGALWIGMGGFGRKGGLARLDGDSLTVYTIADGLLGAEVQVLHVDPAGDLWIGTDEGLSRLRRDGSLTHFTTRHGLPAEPVWAIEDDGDGGLWIGTTFGVVRCDGQRLLDPPHPTMEWLAVRALRRTRDGALWIGGLRGAGLHRYRDGELTSMATQGMEHDAQVLFEDNAGYLWAGTPWDGAARWDGRAWERFGLDDGLPSPSVMAIEQTADGEVWLGTGHLYTGSTNAGNGVVRYDGYTRMTLTTEEGLESDFAVSLGEGVDGEVWIGTLGGSSIFRADTLASFPAQDVWHFHLDGRGRMWIASRRQGLLRYADGVLADLDAEYGLPKSGATWLSADDAGRVWVSGMGWRDAVALADTGVVWRLSEVDSSHSHSVLKGDHDDVWIGTGEGFRQIRAGQVTSQTFGAGIGVSAIRKDRSGAVWLTTWGAGAVRHDEASGFVTYTARDGLGHDRISDVAEDREGHLWFSTWGGGVSRWDGRVFQTLVTEDGLPSNAVHEVLPASNGDIWIATEGGVMRYRPTRTPPPVEITGIVADRRLDPGGPVRIPSTQDLLAVEFRGRSLKTRPNQLVYLYRLRGHDPDWRQTRQPRVEYADLPPGEYVFEVQAVDRDLVYSEKPAAVAVEVFYQPAFGSLALGQLEVPDLFASFYQSYASGLGTVQVTNNDPDTVAATLTLELPEVMRRPVEVPLTLPPQSTQKVSLAASLGAEVLEVRESLPVRAEVSLSFAAGGQTMSVEESRQVTLYGRGALCWDEVSRAAAFVTPADPAVAAFARGILVSFERETASLGRPGHNLLQAAVLFEALRAHGVRYLVDPSQPYARARADAAAVDHIQYPAEALQSRAGDCDDLTVLYAALLESAGVATALVDYPEHIFLLVDTGLARWEAYRLPVEPRLGVVHGDRLWVPVETTLLGHPFGEAWRAGAEEVAKLSGVDLRRRVVPTAEAWTQYAPSAPALAPTPPPERESFAGAVEAGRRALVADVDAYVQRTYLDRLRDDPGDDALRTRLLRLYVALARYDAAIAAGLDFLMDGASDQPTAQNHLGIAYYLKGEVRQAAYYFRQALAARPDDDGIRRNLDQALWALGRAQEPGGVSPVTVATGESPRADAAQVDGDSFYWIE